MPHDARQLVSRQVLEQCLNCQYETENLDFKEALDLSKPKDRLELIKDVLAMANTVGGYIIVGVRDKDYCRVGVSDDASKSLKDGTSVNDKLRGICRDLVTVHAAMHEVTDESGNMVAVALICVLPLEKMLPAPEDGYYDVSRDGKKPETRWVFRKGDVLIRKADSSTRAITVEDYVRRPYSVESFHTFIDPLKKSGLQDFQNPYDFNFAASNEMFKGRVDEINDLLMSVENGAHVSVFGLQRIGKTSLVEEALTSRAKQNPRLKDLVFARVNLQEIGSEFITYKQLLEHIIMTIALAFPETSDGTAVQAAIEQFLAAPRRYKVGDKSGMFEDYKRIIETIVQKSPRQIVLFMDEMSELCRAIERNDQLARHKPNRNDTLHPHEMLVDVPLIHLFSSLLKTKSLQRKLTFVFAIRPFVAEYDRDRGLQLLKLAKPIELNNLEEQAARRLISDPISGAIVVEDAAVDYLYLLTAGHPYLIQFMMQDLVNTAKTGGQVTIQLSDIKRLEEKMINKGVTYEPLFELLDSDYSVDEVMNPKTADLGRGTLALISKIGTVRPGGWVADREVKEELAKFRISERPAAQILKQLEAAKIIEVDRQKDTTPLRVSVPLLRKRYVAQNMYSRYFRNAPN